MKISTRNGGIAGIVAGLGYLIQAVMELIKPQTEVFSGASDFILEIIFIIALLATILALIGLRGHAGGVGFWLAVIGTGLMTISAAATLLAGQNSLGAFFFGGTLMALLGYIILGIVALRSKALPLWAGLALLFGFPLSVFLSAFGGGILFGLAWLGVGYHLMKQ